MGQFVFALKGIGEACRALDFPIVSGNVSLYNETNGQAILPTPTIGGVGLIRDWTKMATVRFKNDGDAILLLGGHGSHMGQTIYMREIHGREDGAPPPVDLARERKHGDFVRGLITTEAVTAVHDISDGGLVSAVIEMALAGNFGASLDAMDHVKLYAEDQSRYVLTCPAKEAAKIITQAHVLGIDVIRIGTVTKEQTVKTGSTSVALSALRDVHEGWLPKLMQGEV